MPDTSLENKFSVALPLGGGVLGSDYSLLNLPFGVIVFFPRCLHLTLLYFWDFLLLVAVPPLLHILLPALILRRPLLSQLILFLRFWLLVFRAVRRNPGDGRFGLLVGFVLVSS